MVNKQNLISAGIESETISATAEENEISVLFGALYREHTNSYENVRVKRD